MGKHWQEKRCQLNKDGNGLSGLELLPPPPLLLPPLLPPPLVPSGVKPSSASSCQTASFSFIVGIRHRAKAKAKEVAVRDGYLVWELCLKVAR